MQCVSKDSKCIPWATSLEQVSYKDVSTRSPGGRAQDYLQLRAASKRPQVIPKLSCAASFTDQTRTPSFVITLQGHIVDTKMTYVLSTAASRSAQRLAHLARTEHKVTPAPKRVQMSGVAYKPVCLHNHQKHQL